MLYQLILIFGITATIIDELSPLGSELVSRLFELHAADLMHVPTPQPSPYVSFNIASEGFYLGKREAVSHSIICLMVSNGCMAKVAESIEKAAFIEGSPYSLSTVMPIVWPVTRLKKCSIKPATSSTGDLLVLKKGTSRVMFRPLYWMIHGKLVSMILDQESLQTNYNITIGIPIRQKNGFLSGIFTVE